MMAGLIGKLSLYMQYPFVRYALIVGVLGIPGFALLLILRWFVHT